MKRGSVNGSRRFPPDLAGFAVGVLVVYQKIGQVAVPYITMKSVAARKFYQFMDTSVEKRRHILSVIKFIPVMLHEPCHII